MNSFNVKNISDISSFLKGLFIAVLFASFICTMADAIGFTVPYNNFLYPGIAAFNDFFEVMNYLHITKTWDLPSIYAIKGINFLPPFCISIYAACALIIKYSKISKWIIFLIVFFVPLGIVLKKSDLFVNKSKYWFLILFSYPILFVVTRGNVAILVFLFLVLSLLYADKIALSMLFLALAVSIKVTPVIFIIYFVAYYKNNIKKLCTTLLLFVAFLFLVNYLSIIFITKTVPATAYDPYNFFQSVKIYDSWMVYEFGGLGYCSSFYLPFRFIIYKAYVYWNIGFCQFLLNVKPLLINFIVVIILLLIYLYKHSLKSLFEMVLDKNKMLKVASIIFILFTPITNDYYLTVLFLPLFFIPFNQFTFQEKVIFFLLLIPKNLYLNRTALSIQDFINPALLLALLLIVMDIYNFNFISGNSKERRLEVQ